MSSRLSERAGFRRIERQRRPSPSGAPRRVQKPLALTSAHLANLCGALHLVSSVSLSVASNFDDELSNISHLDFKDDDMVSSSAGRDRSPISSSLSSLDQDHAAVRSCVQIFMQLLLSSQNQHRRVCLLDVSIHLSCF